jgi:uncharacterized SAM-binding protein YcdF (DUF218 family)
MPSADIDHLAKIIWDYHHVNQLPEKSDAVFCLCSIDTRVAERAAELFLDGYGDYLIFSGGIAHTNDPLKVRWEGSEADHFAKVAIAKGVPPSKIIIENRARNTGENIQFTYQLLQERGLHPRSLLLVQKPYMERRTYATFKKQWPNPATSFTVTSPQIAYDDYFNDDNPKELIIHIMVGDLQRIKEYPKRGFQIPQEIPHEVWAAYEQLVALGYTKHLAH